MIESDRFNFWFKKLFSIGCFCLLLGLNDRGNSHAKALNQLHQKFVYVIGISS